MLSGWFLFLFKSIRNSNLKQSKVCKSSFFYTHLERLIPVFFVLDIWAHFWGASLTKTQLSSAVGNNPRHFFSFFLICQMCYKCTTYSITEVIVLSDPRHSLLNWAKTAITKLDKKKCVCRSLPLVKVSVSLQLSLKRASQGGKADWNSSGLNQPLLVWAHLLHALKPNALWACVCAH